MGKKNSRINQKTKNGFYAGVTLKCLAQELTSLMQSSEQLLTLKCHLVVNIDEILLEKKDEVAQEK